MRFILSQTYHSEAQFLLVKTLSIAFYFTNDMKRMSIKNILKHFKNLTQESAFFSIPRHCEMLQNAC